MKKYIITDPCYIIEDKQYQAIGDALGWLNFTKISGSTLTYQRGGTFVLHKISGTPNGDGSTTYNEQQICVDAGMLCIAERAEGWVNEMYGATFDTLADARKMYAKLLRRF